MDNPTPNTPKVSQGDSMRSKLDALTKENPTESNAIKIPQISLPKGGGALKGIDEKFEVNAANGTSSFSIPLPITPGRNGFSPSLSLSYNSGGGNSPFGLGWSIGYPSFQRKTDKRLPRYGEGETEDTFMFSGAEDLVPMLEELKEGDEYKWKTIERQDGDYIVKRYRPRVEGGFARIEKITQEKENGKNVYWKVTTRENIVTIFGRQWETRIADPESPARIFEWLPEFSYDDKGNWIKYQYKKDTNLDKDGNLKNDDSIPNSLFEKNRKTGLAPFTNTYLKRVQYGNKKPYFPERIDGFNYYDPSEPEDEEHFFELVFDYGEHRKSDELGKDEAPTYGAQRTWQYRPDAFSSYRSGFEIRTNRRCFGVMMFHHFKDEANFGEKYLVRSLDFKFKPSSVNDSGIAEVTYLQSITQSGYIRLTYNKDDSLKDTYSKKSLPPMEFEYQDLDWNTEIRVVPPEEIMNAPVGLTNNYQWVDLYGEGISGILTEQGGGWYYKSNLGDLDEDRLVQFTPAKRVVPRPSFSGISSGVLSIQDLEANGEKQVVVNSPGLNGFFELAPEDGDEFEEWEPFLAFEENVNIDLQDPNTRLIDINGDGRPELVVSEDNVFVWYPGNGKRGYKPAEFTAKTFDEEKGPAIVFADQEQTIFLADMSGDGLTDIVRIRNGEICYWANKGYGHFSAKVNMGNAPIFDHPDLFNPQYLHLADVDGTGATDIFYLGKNEFRAYLNLSGNSWSDAHTIDPFFPIDISSRISVIDLLGTGASCIVWSSDLPTYANAPMRYIDLMDSRKPHVMKKYVNNFGKETSVEYKSSTYYYLKDKMAGKPWKTKLPFPVQLVSQTIVEDKITDVRFSSQYRYHHGYYDHVEREFRGFGMVEQEDTEHYETWKKNNANNQLESSEELYQPPVLTKTWYHTGTFLERKGLLEHFKKEYWQAEYNRLFPETPLLKEIEEYELPDARVMAAKTIQDSRLLANPSASSWREAVRACKGMPLRQEVFALDASVPKAEARPEAIEKYQRRFKPYSVATHTCNIQLLQPKVDNAHAVFIVQQSEALTYHYERNETDPRIAHTLNIKFDDLGNILESASVVYGRKRKKAEDTRKAFEDKATDFLDSNEQAKLANALAKNLRAATEAQTTTYIIYTQNSFADFNNKGQIKKDIDLHHVYRLRLPKESKSFEITGLSKRHGKDFYQLEDFNDVLKDDTSTPTSYNQTPRVGRQERRLIGCLRTVYLKDDLSGASPFGKFESKGIPFENYQLAYTPGLLTTVFGRKIANQAESMNDGKFVDLKKEDAFAHLQDEKTAWWIRSGTIEYDPTFYLPKSYTDPFGSTTTVEYYKDYRLFIQSTEDELKNKVSVENFNFRILGPQCARDQNDNLSGVLVDELGLVTAVAVLGKDLDGDGTPELELADNLDGLTVFTTEAERDSISMFFQTEDSDDLNTRAKALLKNATSRFLYDFDVYKNAGSPVVVSAISRETHYAHVPNGRDSALQLSFEYSDGMGNVVVAKAQGEPGEARYLNDNGALRTRDTGYGLRWLATGRTILNNKGNPVKQYEPYFSTKPHFEQAEFLVKIGVSPIFYYDPIGRLYKTELPDDTFSEVVFAAWQQTSFDQNDTVLRSDWYAQRKDGQMGLKEKVAAEKAAQHAETPSLIVLDSLGRPVLSIAHNGKDENDKAKLYTTAVDLDIEGNVKTVTDARGNLVMQYSYDMLGHRVYQNSMDAGERWMLNNVMGNPVKQWDSKNHVFSFEYDHLQRPSIFRVAGGLDAVNPFDHIYEKITYGEGLKDAAGQSIDKRKNLRGQVHQHYDSSGKITIVRSDLKGNTLEVQRQLATAFQSPVIDWTEGSATYGLEEEVFTSITEYDALNRMTRLYNWHRTPQRVTVYEPVYNERGMLVAEDHITNARRIGDRYADGRRVTAVTAIEYNEKGQRIRMRLGNQTTTRYFYDQKTFRLIQLRTTTNVKDRSLPTASSNLSEPGVFQNLYYTYDPVGNITEIEDDAFGPEFFKGQLVEPKSRYTYDPLYRLIAAEGRENKTFNNAPEPKEPNVESTIFPIQAQVLRNYRQVYTYDPVGNILQMRHLLNGENTRERWTRNYTYALDSNRLLQTWKGNDQINAVTYRYDAHGNMLNYNNTLEEYRPGWDYRDMIHHLHLGGGGDVYYQYSAERDRSRKHIIKGPITEERLYLGGMVVYRRWRNGDLEEEIETVHLFLDDQRILLVENVLQTNNNQLRPGILDRYQYSNHLGSVSAELDGFGAIISYEEYHPYGTVAYHAKSADIKAAAKRYRYTGMERDEESGLSYHGARYYMGWLGRWLSADPIGVEGGLNLFVFVSNNPIIRTDRNGRKDKSENVELAKGFLEGALQFYIDNQLVVFGGAPYHAYQSYNAMKSGMIGFLKQINPVQPIIDSSNELVEAKKEGDPRRGGRAIFNLGITVLMLLRGSKGTSRIGRPPTSMTQGLISVSPNGSAALSRVTIPTISIQGILGEFGYRGGILMAAADSSQNGGDEGYSSQQATDSELAPNSSSKILNRGFPMGFRSLGQFRQFAAAFNAGLKKHGFPDARAAFQGSSVTGRNHETKIAFDEGRVSDFDIAISSQRLFRRAKSLGFNLRDDARRTGPLKPEEVHMLGLTEFQSRLSKLVGGRSIKFMVFGTESGVKAKGPSLWIPNE